MNKIIAMLVVAVVLVSPVFSEEKIDKEKEQRYKDIRKMMELSQATKMFDQMKTGIKANIGKLVQEQNLFKDIEMTGEAKALYEDYLSKTMDMSMGLVNMEDIINDMVPWYDKYLANEDIKSIIAFYESPAGKRFLEAAPKIMTDAMPKMYEKMGAKMKKMQETTEKTIKEFAEKLKAIKEKQKKEKKEK